MADGTPLPFGSGWLAEAILALEAAEGSEQRDTVLLALSADVTRARVALAEPVAAASSQARLPARQPPGHILGQCLCRHYSAGPLHRPDECYWCRHVRSEHDGGTGACVKLPLGRLGTARQRNGGAQSRRLPDKPMPRRRVRDTEPKTEEPSVLDLRADKAPPCIVEADVPTSPKQ